MIDQPLQYFFSNNTSVEKRNKNEKFDLSGALELAGVTGTVKLVVLPKAQDVLMFRLENLGDLDSK